MNFCMQPQYIFHNCHNEIKREKVVLFENSFISQSVWEVIYLNMKTCEKCMMWSISWIELKILAASAFVNFILDLGSVQDCVLDKCENISLNHQFYQSFQGHNSWIFLFFM